LYCVGTCHQFEIHFTDGKIGKIRIIRGLQNVGVRLLLNEKIQLVLPNNKEFTMELVIL
jgi:hypothetical protein